MLGYEDTEIFNYMTKNRKLKLEEYDDDGNLIEIRELDNEDLFVLCLHNTNMYKATKFARKEDLDKFNEKEIEIINKIFDDNAYNCCENNQQESFPFYWFDNNTVEWFQKFFQKYNIDEIRAALELVDYKYGGKFNTSSKSLYFNIKFNFISALKFIKKRDGIYFTVNDRGERIYDFVDKPTKKQVKYQRTKNGNKCVFLSFKDFKRYLVKEDELK